MFERLGQDLQRYYALDGESAGNPLLEKCRLWLITPGIHAALVYRYGSWVERTVGGRLVRIPLRILYFMLDHLCIAMWGIHIDPRAEIAGGLYIGHFSGVLIGPIKMGRDCNVAHHVTIGTRADGTPGVPTIGDRVWIGVGSVIYGNIQIGDGATIGPLTVVGRSLPPRALVMGNPLRVLRSDYDNSLEIYGRTAGQSGADGGDLRPPQ